MASMRLSAKLGSERIERTVLRTGLIDLTAGLLLAAAIVRDSVLYEAASVLLAIPAVVLTLAAGLVPAFLGGMAFAKWIGHSLGAQTVTEFTHKLRKKGYCVDLAGELQPMVGVNSAAKALPLALLFILAGCSFCSGESSTRYAAWQHRGLYAALPEPAQLDAWMRDEPLPLETPTGIIRGAAKLRAVEWASPDTPGLVFRLALDFTDGAESKTVGLSVLGQNDVTPLDAANHFVGVMTDSLAARDAAVESLLATYGRCEEHCPKGFAFHGVIEWEGPFNLSKLQLVLGDGSRPEEIPPPAVHAAQQRFGDGWTISWNTMPRTLEIEEHGYHVLVISQPLGRTFASVHTVGERLGEPVSAESYWAAVNSTLAPLGFAAPSPLPATAADGCVL